jgi:hypothetical protein
MWLQSNEAVHPYCEVQRGVADVLKLATGKTESILGVIEAKSGNYHR